MNKHLSLTLVFLFILNLSTWAKKKEIKYPVSTISEELRKNANTVVRLDKTTFSVESIKKATLKNHEVITILNKSGEHASKKIIHYDKLIQLKSFKISIYNADGKLIKRAKNSEIKDYSATSGGTLFDDNRVKYYEALQNEYPFTIEYEYERVFNGTLSYPEWVAVNGYNRSVEQSELIINTPVSIKTRTKAYRFEGEYLESTLDGIDTYKWRMANIKAFKSEPYAPDFINIVPRVVSAPIEFEMEGFKGSQASWKSFGLWMQELGKGRTELPLETISEINDLVVDCKTDFEKIETLYKYMQAKTRYVSIQLGIGGWQPFPAETVNKLGYGDCKALSNYMKSLLRVVGIHSNYTLVKAGNGKHHFDKNFVKNQFNHAILMVPLAQDSVWLECTSQRQACGFLGSFTNDRDVLIIKDDGGELVHTPIYAASENTQDRNVEITILEDGNAIAKTTTNYSGLQYENLRSIYYDGPEDQKKALYESISISDFTIEKLNLEQEKERIPKSKLELELNIKNYLSKTGDRLFMPLNLMNRSTYVPKKLKERKFPIVLDYPYCDRDTIHYTLPENMIIENLPKMVKIETEFGKYQSKVDVLGNKVIYIRSQEMYTGEFTTDKYEALRKFYKAIVRADKAKIILKLKG